MRFAQKSVRWVGVAVAFLGIASQWLAARPFRASATVDRTGYFVADSLQPSTVIHRRSPLQKKPAETSTNSAPSAPPGAVQVASWSSGKEVVLVLGLDRGPGKRGAGLTDTLIAVVLDHSRTEVGLLSVPRDLFVQIPDSAPDRINTVYSLARRTGRDPLTLLRRVFQDTLALSVDHMLVIDLGVVERGIDALGGVAVNVPCAIIDDFVDSRTDTGRRLLNVPAGEVLMNGATAAMYMRSRHGRSDWSRARRQQSVLMAMRRRMLGADGLRQLPELWTMFGSALDSDMSRMELLATARRLLLVDPAKLHGLVLGPEHTEPWRTPDGRAVLLPKTAQIRRAVRTVFNAPTPGKRNEGMICPGATVALRKSTKEQLSNGTDGENDTQPKNRRPSADATRDEQASEKPLAPGIPAKALVPAYGAMIGPPKSNLLP